MTKNSTFITENGTFITENGTFITENGTTDRIGTGRAVYARNFGIIEAKAEALMIERVGRELTLEAFNAAGRTSEQSTALTHRDRSRQSKDADSLHQERVA